jgi:hypothetical protein
LDGGVPMLGLGAWTNFPTYSHAVTWRWFVVQLPANVPLTGTGLPYNNIFENVTANVLLDEVNRDSTKVIKSGYWRPNQQGLQAAGGDEFTFCKTMFIPHKTLYKFGPTDSQQTHNQNPVYFFAMVYDAYGSLITDNIAYYQIYTKFMYKDV